MDTDALDIAIQGSVTTARLHLSSLVTYSIFSMFRKETLMRWNAAEYFQKSSKLLEKEYQEFQTCVTATIDMLGKVGVTILIGLKLIPIPMIFQYRKGILANVESLYKRAAMKNDGGEGFEEVPSTAPRFRLIAETFRLSRIHLECKDDVLTCFEVGIIAE